MKLTINAFWIYGWLVYKLGEYKHDETIHETKFHMLGQIYDSSWLACVDLNRKLDKLDPVRWDGEDSDYKGGEFRAWSDDGDCAVGVKFEGQVGRLNCPPEQEALDTAKKRMLELLAVVGISNVPEPKLYFMTEVKDD